MGKIGGDEEYLVAGRKLADVGLEGAADGTGGVREGDREGDQSVTPAPKPWVVGVRGAEIEKQHTEYVDGVLLGEDLADLLASRLAQSVQTCTGVGRHFLDDAEVVGVVGFASDGEVGARVDQALVAHVDGDAHGVVRAHGVHVPGDLTVRTQNGAIDDDVATFGGTAYLIQVRNIDRHGLVGRPVGWFDVGDPQAVVAAALQLFHYPGAQLPAAAQQTDLHTCASPWRGRPKSWRSSTSSRRRPPTTGKRAPAKSPCRWNNR